RQPGQQATRSEAVLDHPRGGPVLDRPSRILPFGLGVELDTRCFALEAPQPDERRPPDEIENGRGSPLAYRRRSRRHDPKCDLKSPDYTRTPLAMSETDAVPVGPQLDTTAKLGGWLFQRRTWLPLPIAATLLALPKTRLPVSTPGLWLGMPLIVAGELLRLWGVRHIGAVSRTR